MQSSKRLTISQQILICVLYSLVVILIIFSIGATKNLGEEGYNECLQKLCVEHGPEACQKYRYVNNCCLGAAGKVSQSSNGFGCYFNK